ncbi:AP-like endonuclease reverse transcriptase, partial [Brachionus plicatilis]
MSVLIGLSLKSFFNWLYKHVEKELNDSKDQISNLTNNNIWRFFYKTINFNSSSSSNPKKPLNLLNYNVYRPDRLFRKGGGAAICIKKTLSGNPIDLSNILTHENGIGCELDLKNNKKLAIFSIYCSPCTRINPEIFDHIKNKHLNSVIIGDLNAKNSMWHCKSTDPKGEVLENILSELNMHVLNSSKCTYNRRKSVLDLSICSNSIRKYFESHQVLDFKISDHQPTMTTFKSNLEFELSELSNFKQNETKCWDSLKRFEQGCNKKNSNINSDKIKNKNGDYFKNDKDLANAFGAKLETIFNPSTQIEIPNPSRTHANSFRDEKKDLRDALIDRQEFMKALALTNPKSAPGLDK